MEANERENALSFDERKIFMNEMDVHQRLLDNTYLNLTGDLPIRNSELSELQDLYLSAPYLHVTNFMKRIKYFRLPEIFNLYIGFPYKRKKLIKDFLVNCPSKVNEIFFNGSKVDSIDTFKTFSYCLSKCADKAKNNFTIFSLIMTKKDFMDFIASSKLTKRIELFECILPTDTKLKGCK